MFFGFAQRRVKEKAAAQIESWPAQVKVIATSKDHGAGCLAGL